MANPQIIFDGFTAGEKAAYTAGATVEASLDSTSGVRGVTWSIASTDETSEVSDYTLATSGSIGQNVSTTALGEGTAAILQCAYYIAETRYVVTAKFGVLTTGGLWVGAVGEALEHDPTYGSTGIINEAVRSVAGSVVSSIGVTAPIATTGGTSPNLSWSPAANVAMGGYGFTGCTGVANASGGVTISAGSGTATIDASSSVTIGATSATTVLIGRSGQTIRLPAFAGGGSQTLTVDGSGNVGASAGGGSSYTAGAGLTESPSGTFNVAAGDSTITVNANDIVVASGGLTNTHINASAAIDGTKVSPNFGSQNIVTTGEITAGSGGFIGAKFDVSSATTMSIGATNATRIDFGKSGSTVRLVPLASAGVVHVDASGDTSSSLIVNADVSASAAIDGSKISPSFTSAATVAVADSATGAGTVVLALEHTTSGTATTNFDGQITVSLENASGTKKLATNMVHRWSTATAGNETAQIAWRAMGVGGAATSDKWLWYYDGNFFGDYITFSNVFASATSTGFRFNDSGNRGGLDQDGSNNLRLKSYNSKQFVVQTGADASGVGGVTRQTVESTGNVAWFGAGSYGGGVLVHFIANASTNPSTNPTGGGILYSDAGAGKWRGSSGTVTTFGTAEPHCPACGRDFAHEWENSRTGEHLAICVPCMLEEMASAGLNTSAFAFIRKGL